MTESRSWMVESEIPPPNHQTGRGPALPDLRSPRGFGPPVSEIGLFGSLVRSNARLRRLRESGFVQHLPSEIGYGPTDLHRCTALGLPIVAHSLGLDRREVGRFGTRPFSWLQIEHTLAVTNLRIAFEQALRSHGIGSRWIPEPLCRHEYSVKVSGSWRRRIFKPDGLLQVGFGAERINAFIEVDRGHVSSAKFTQKIENYRQYLREAYTETYDNSDFNVLVMTSSQTRLHNLARLIPAGPPTFMFGVATEVQTAGPLVPVWFDPHTDRYEHPFPVLEGSK